MLLSELTDGAVISIMIYVIATDSKGSSCHARLRWNGHFLTRTPESFGQKFVDYEMDAELVADQTELVLNSLQ